MCGILGQLNRKGEPVDIRRLVAANNLQRHRGPDDEGYFLMNTAKLKKWLRNLQENEF